MFSESDIPDLSGRVAVVTGANSGLGLETTRMLSARGARVVMACRNTIKGDEARASLLASLEPSRSAELEVAALNLADLTSVRSFAEELSHDTVDLLINNAGVMALPRRETADGFELQIGTNHLGHFALTGYLLPKLLAAPAARIVTVSSLMHRVGAIDLADLHGERRYRKWPAYGQSKLANLLFAFELDRRLRRADAAAVSVAAHPGYAATNLQGVGPRMEGARWFERATQIANRFVAQDAAMGALPQVYAAVAPGVRGGDYFGPSGAMEMTGPPTRVSSSAKSRDEALARRLWEVSEDCTGVRYAPLDRQDA